MSPDQYRKIQQHVKDAIIHSVQKLREQKPDLAIGSSGTIINLAEIAHRNLHQNTNSSEIVLTYKDLQKVIGILCSLPLEERKKIPGINPERADIIIPGQLFSICS